MKFKILIYCLLFSIQWSAWTAEKKIEICSPLSDQWLAIIINYMDDTDRQIYSKDPVYWDSSMKAWKNYDLGENIDWYTIKTMTANWKKDYVKFSRQHLFLSDPVSFKIRSSTDSNFLKPQTPERAHAWVSSAGDRDWSHSPIRSEFKFEVIHTAYIKLPFKMIEGHQYTLELNDGRKTSFKFGDSGPVTPAIKINQEGYLPQVRKYAYLGQWIPVFGSLKYDQKKFELKNEKNETVFTGQIQLRALDEKKWGRKSNESYSGENIYSMDFSSFKKPGKYKVYVPGLGVSHFFEIGDHALAKAFYTSARGFYYQRCGCEITGKWARKKCHTDPVYKCSFIDDGVHWRIKKEKAYKMVKHFDFKAIKQSFDTSEPKTITGGWHDAADYDKRKYHHQSIWDLLGLFELNKTAFGDSQLNLPESNNKIPDLLDEAAWGLSVWQQAQEKDGGVCGRIESISHPNHQGMPENDKLKYALTLPDRDSTMHYAASASWYARLIGSYSKPAQKKYLASALKAYRWARDKKNNRHGQILKLYINDKGAKVKGELEAVYQDVEENHFFPGMLAAVNLYLLTGENEYKKDLESIYFPYCYQNFDNASLRRKFYWSMALYMSFEKGFSRALQIKAAQKFIKVANSYVTLQETIPYRHTWKHNESRRWGNALPANFAAFLAVAWKLTGDTKYRDSALLNLDYHLGCNPLGVVQTTGIGKNSLAAVMDIESREDNVIEPVPGISNFGLIEIPWHFKNNVYRMETGKNRWTHFLPKEYQAKDGNFRLPLWRQTGPNSWVDAINNEFTVNETMGALTVALGLFLKEGWYDEKLKKPLSFNRYWFP
jgi:endoglucanase